MDALLSVCCRVLVAINVHPDLIVWAIMKPETLKHRKLQLVKANIMVSRTEGPV
jgi:hypothetical protein